MYIWLFLIFTGVGFTALVWLKTKMQQQFWSNDLLHIMLTKYLTIFIIRHVAFALLSMMRE